MAITRSHFSHALALAGALMLFGAACASASGDGRPGTPAQRKACTPDVYRFCAGEIPSVSKITSCLRSKKERLSEACRAVFEQPPSGS